MIQAYMWPDHARYAPSMLEAIDMLRTAEPRSRLRYGGTWASRHVLSELAPFRPLLEWLRPRMPHAGPLSAWAFVMGMGTECQPHTHGTKRCAAVYYLRAPLGSGEFVAGGSVITPKDGQVLVFPGDLEHAVTTHQTLLERVSIGVNGA